MPQGKISHTRNQVWDSLHAKNVNMTVGLLKKQLIIPQSDNFAVCHSETKILPLEMQWETQNMQKLAIVLEIDLSDFPAEYFPAVIHKMEDIETEKI